MATNPNDIRNWLQSAEENHTHMMVVVCDTSSCDDYPIFVSKDEDVHKIYKEYNGIDTQRIMEIYNLSMDLEEQLKQYGSL